MHQPRKWWIGLPVLAGLAYVAGQSLIPQAEADLEARATAALSGIAGKSQVSVNGRDVALAGLASPEKAQALAALRAVPGLRKVVDASAPPPAAALETAPPPPSPGESYVFSVNIRESVIALDGKLPSDELRKMAVALASSTHPGLAVMDGAQIDAGAPQGDYAAALRAALDALGALAQGKATLSAARLSIEGKGKANVRAAALEQDVKTRLPQGFVLDRLDVAAGPVSPYVFEATRAAGKITLTGFAPDEATHKRILNAARRRLFGATVEDQLVVAEGARDGFIDAVEAALTAIARLDDGKLSMTDARVSLSGAARFELARGEVEDTLAQHLPKGFESDVRLTAHTVGSSLDAAACRSKLEELAKTQIVFEADDATIAEDSVPLLDALTVMALRCQGAPIEVAGHTDNQGIEELNRARSKRRAQTLVDRFVKAGADSSKVWAAGYGAERPVAPNDTEENRARNRRIEFIVK